MVANRPTDFKYSCVRWHGNGGGRRAFTLTELLVVLATLAILVVVLLPALAGTQPAGAKAFQCMNNLRQMAVAWTLYAEDNHDRLVNNYGSMNVQTEAKNKTYGSWANNFMNWGFTDSLGNYNTNYDGIIKAPFYLYTRSMVIYKCPADNYLSTLQQSVGGPLSWRPRSYSMNGFFGANTPNYNPPYNQFYSAYRQFLKTSAISSPANLCLLLEEAPDSINDGLFDNDASPSIARWSDLPGSNHSGAAGFAFADGHSEIHQWKSRVCTILPVRFGSFAAQTFANDVTGAGFQDGKWLASHSSVPR